MTSSDRWARIEALYHAAWPQGAAERAAFLDQACAGDADLRREVESLLAQPVTGEGMMDTPALGAGARLLAPAAPLLTGRRLGVYTLQELLGAGGMGEVYRARDTTLGRDVAIKILPGVFNTDAERRARFEREARLLAALNHPHIAAIYGVENSTSVRALVLELVEGDTLADRLAHGPLPIKEALRLASQIADALDAAHEKGIVHRDLKPANIKITPDGQVKVLDFGLAKAATGDATGRDLTHSPTLTVGATRGGVILGTAAYMSPEQARGQAIDKRSDVWAFGCVLYEMLTGRIAFAEDTVSDTIAAILDRAPTWSALPEATPEGIRRLLVRCLEKDAKRRLRDIGDARMELDDLRSGAAANPSSAPNEAATTSSSRTRRLGWLVAAVTALVAVSSIYLRPLPGPPPDHMRVDIVVAPQTLELGSGFALSPDARTLAFQAAGSDLETRIWIRPMNSEVAKPITGSEGAGFQSIFWSPDSRFVAFAIGGTLKKIELATGAVQTICEVPLNIVGGTWNRGNEIVFGQNFGPLMRVDASNGQAVPPVPVTRLDTSRNEGQHVHPFFLSDGVRFLYRTRSDVYVGSLAAAPDAQDARRILIGTESGASYVPSPDSTSGHLVFMNEQALYAQRFDERTLTLSGEPVFLAGPVASYFDRALYSVTASHLVFRPGKAGRQQLAWYAPNTPLFRMGDPGMIVTAAVSPNNRRVAFTRRDVINRGVMSLDLTRDVGEIRLTSGATDDSLVWSGDSNRLAYRSQRAGQWKTYEQPASGEGTETMLLDTPAIPTSWSMDNQFLLHTVADPATRRDVWVLSLRGDRTRTRLLSGTSDEHSAAFSPDGQFVAYLDNRSSRQEVYVRAFYGGSTPSLGEATKVSNGGADQIHWATDRKTLFYRIGLKMMAVEYTVEDKPARTFRPRGPERLHMPLPGGFQSRGLAADGGRALLVVPESEALQGEALAVLAYWQSRLPN